MSKPHIAGFVRRLSGLILGGFLAVIGVTALDAAAVCAPSWPLVLDRIEVNGTPIAVPGDSEGPWLSAGTVGVRRDAPCEIYLRFVWLDDDHLGTIQAECIE